eukprot:gene33813-30945_t
MSLLMQWHPDEYVFKPLSDAGGLPIDQVRLLSCLFASFPLGALLQAAADGAGVFPQGQARYAHALLWGLMASWACFKWDTYHSLLVSVVSFFLIKARKVLPIDFSSAVFFWAFGY